MKPFRLGSLAVLAAMTLPLAAQAPASTTDAGAVAPFDEMTSAEITAKAAELLKIAQAGGNGSVTLKKYGDHITMLTVRTKSGGAEQHNAWNDIFVVVDGEATEMIGGTIVDSKESSPGELRGTRVEGGVPHVMRKGDVVHISPGTPHQTMLAPGKTFTYYVIKVKQ